LITAAHSDGWHSIINSNVTCCLVFHKQTFTFRSYPGSLSTKPAVNIDHSDSGYR